MLSERLFARFSKTTTPPRIDEIPDGGFCLSSFVILAKTGRSSEILLGKLNVDGPWERIGGLDRERAERNRSGWILPASQLLYGESPQNAAERILDEQLGITDQKLEGPWVFSEVYGPKNHWDLEFLFSGERAEVRSHAAWKELRFVDTTKLRREDFARSHEDILAHLGKWRG